MTSHIATLNGKELAVAADGKGGWSMPSLAGRSMTAGDAIEIDAASYSFLSFIGAAVPGCGG